ncbi:type II toxin-antitoxin system Phd/YefM family antitoxin [Mycobacterium avium]|uniref:Antitoxin n=1 Tax=Mycobacterium avium subsp. hominissuis TaxID=439334 RepID=A0AAI8STD4_MYCAV|nr:type II toxin-antitoxin system prevent-host-death family antitoxin [Mycobacterium avium]PBA08493.1 type II toxin-antitoxin system prevent-host-death family antitoxin [Mycobacterium avium]BBN50877.1 hypothetical protein JPH1_53520 [Mycobacterium avium subsp. hominissuis]
MDIELAELAERATELVRRARCGESIMITDAGRPAARLLPPAPKVWRQWADIADVFEGGADAAWQADRDLANPSTTSGDCDVPPE